MKPILFNTEMVKAILDGRKTATRRVAFPNKDLRKFPRPDNPDAWWFRGRAYTDWNSAMRSPQGVLSLCKYKEGDVLYVRETWAYGYVDTTDFECRCNECFFEELKAGTEKDSFLMPRYFYRTENLDGLNVRWHPSIHMPKEAARLFLRVTDVRVERLQDINGIHAKAEGCEGYVHINPLYGCPETVHNFKALWDTTIKPAELHLYGWEANPWVWVIEFDRCEKLKEGEA